jgi:hypothetical protein
MMHRWRMATWLVVVLAAGWLSTAPGHAQEPPPADPQLQEARRSFDQLNFEAVRDLLTTMITRLTQDTPDERSRGVLTAAYELRGRALQNLRDIDGARADFRSMLTVDPGYAFPPEAGARAMALFEEVRAATVGNVEIAVAPADATVQVDGRTVADRPLRLTLVAGVHALTAARRGHASMSQQFDVRPGEMATVNVALERTLSSVTLQTIPSNVTVLLDGAARGVTAAATGAAPASDSSDEMPSQPFVIEELPNGRHRIELRRDCYVDEQRQLDLQKPDGVRLNVLRLRPATGTISVRSEAGGATVYVDDRPGGEAPQVLTECQGPHVIEVRTRGGRDLRRFDVKTGDKEEFVANVRPAFAIMSDGDLLKTNAAEDGRIRVEALFHDSKTVTLFAPSRAQVTQSTAAATLPSDWLTFDVNGTPLKGAGALGTAGLQAATARVAMDIEAQGLAAVVPDAGDRQSALLVLLAPRSARPDVLRWRMDDPNSARQVVARLDVSPTLTQASLGMLALDVLDVPGVVVGAIDPGGAAATAGLQVGDVVTAAGGKPVTTAAGLLTAAAATAPGQALSLDVRDRTGATRKVDVPVSRLPHLLDPRDETVLANALAVTLTARAPVPMPAIDAAAIRMNLAVAWMRLENWGAAIRELEAVEPLTRDTSLAAGTKEAIAANAQYLIGLCATKSGDVARAQQAFTSAGQSSSVLLTDSAEPLKELAAKRLAELTASRAGR